MAEKWTFAKNVRTYVTVEAVDYAEAFAKADDALDGFAYGNVDYGYVSEDGTYVKIEPAGFPDDREAAPSTLDEVEGLCPWEGDGADDGNVEVTPCAIP